MKKIFNRVISQIIAISISVQMIGQYGASFIPLINAVDNENKTEISEIPDEVSGSEIDAETFEAEKELESVVNEIADDGEESETTAESEYEDWNITSDTTLKETKEVNNLTISNETLNLNGNDIIVHGDVTLNYNGNLQCGTGFLTCNNFMMNSGSCLYMTNINDHIIVNGNFMHSEGSVNSSNATAGTIEIKGDFTSKTSGFNPTAEHIVILESVDTTLTT